MAARKTKTAAKRKVAREDTGTRKKKVARTKKTARSGQGAGTAKARRPARKPSRSWTTSVTERFTELVEHAAAGALRRVVDAGGREFGAWLPESTELRVESGAYLRELRELTGLTIDELAAALDLSDRSILEAVEAGTATLSFELILRLAAILARHDPGPFVTRLVRSYNPLLWQLMEDWGVGRLPLQAVREREFVNVLRARDEARELSDEEFERVLDFTRTAFETALHFAAKSTRDGS
jgi:transcriptional regulator with XRE-family HTH domain